MPAQRTHERPKGRRDGMTNEQIHNDQ